MNNKNGCIGFQSNGVERSDFLLLIIHMLVEDQEKIIPEFIMAEPCAFLYLLKKIMLNAPSAIVNYKKTKKYGKCLLQSQNNVNNFR